MRRPSPLALLLALALLLHVAPVKSALAATPGKIEAVCFQLLVRLGVVDASGTPIGGGSGDLTGITETGDSLTITNGTGPAPDIAAAADLENLVDNWAIDSSGNATAVDTVLFGAGGSASAVLLGTSANHGYFGVDDTSHSLAINGTEELRLTTTGLDLATGELRFGSAPGTAQSGLIQSAAGIIAATNGAGTTADILADDLFLGSVAAAGVQFSISSGSVRLLDGDGTALANGEGFELSGNTGCARLQTDAGAVGAPSFSFVSDTNTGMYRIGADNIGFATNGTLAFDVTSAQVVRANVAITADADNGAALGSTTVGWSNLYMETGINTTAGDAATINAPAGRFRKDTTGVTFTLTNSVITANSIVLLANHNTGMEAIGLSVVAGAGSATISFSAAPGSNFDVGFWVINND